MTRPQLNHESIREGRARPGRIIFLAMMLLGFASAQICTNSAVCPAGTRGPLLYMTLTTIPRRVHLIDRPLAKLGHSPVEDVCRVGSKHALTHSA